MKKYISTFLIILFCTTLHAGTAFYNIKDYGAVGDGQTLDTPAINKAIESASKAGGGTVFFPAGTYKSYSIHLKSNITIYLDQGSVLLAAETVEGQPGYDHPETNKWGDVHKYQDFGHSHWRNSLMWGENLVNVSITGPGLIDGSKGLSRWGGRPFSPREQQQREQKPGEERPRPERPREDQPVDLSRYNDYGNKAIALKQCRNVIIKDVSFLLCGHFCVLATGIDNMTIDNVKIDTNRDGLNIDCCHNVRISNCTVNTPNDDAIVLKSTFALGMFRSTENLSITNCQVMGYDPGTFLDGTFQTTQELAPDKGGMTGRIKMGTESNGGFRNISISNCVFDRCRGLALETVDGGILEDVTISNITMRNITNAPFFLRVGRRMRAPENTPIGTMRRINISNVIVHNVEPRYGVLIMGIPGHDVTDVKMSNIQIYVKGGAPKEQGNIEVPEMEDGYPDPRMYGDIPAYGFYMRHVDGIELHNVNVSYENEDMRPAFILDDVKNSEFNFIQAQNAKGIPTFKMKDIKNITIFNSGNIENTTIDQADQKNL